MPAIRHMTSTKQITRDWIERELFPLCHEFDKRRVPGQELRGRALYCLFYEPSFITRTSFERAMGLLGGQWYHTEDASQFFPVTTPNFIDNVIGVLASLRVDVVVLRSSERGVMDRAEAADALPIVNGGSLDDHPTQALADILTISRELGKVDGAHVAIMGRMEHRNVAALLTGLATFQDVKVTLVPFSGDVDPAVVQYCEGRGMKFARAEGHEALRDADAIYLNSPRTIAHVQLLRSRNAFNLRIDAKFMSVLQPHCIILDPMQRSGDFIVEVQDKRLAFYRQSENALVVRMALLKQVLG
ncbi:MAG: hypothetical protein FJ312_04270 [SAR202 cluster bacterium]|nr:hypothetical protein [SAR202 cluster bacterium]